VNYNRELRVGADIKRKEKIKNAMEFVKRMKKIQKEVEVALRRVTRKNEETGR